MFYVYLVEYSDLEGNHEVYFVSKKNISLKVCSKLMRERMEYKSFLCHLLHVYYTEKENLKNNWMVSSVFIKNI